MAEDNGATIVIKKIKKGGHGGHHGGAWKVAYADFVTAMMAFFLLLWLLQATTEEQKLGIADYFAQSSASRSRSGSGGIGGGQTMTKEGAKVGDAAPVGVTIAMPFQVTEEELDQLEAKAEDSGPSSGEVDIADKEERQAKAEAQQFEEAEAALRQAIQSVPELQSLSKNLLIDQTAEGMRIQIVDQDGTSMFPLGSADMYEHTNKLIELVVSAIRQLPHKISIKGHTDAKGYNTANGYSNWELSTDRANSSRRALLKAGLGTDRIESVTGRAAQEPLIVEDPYSPQNRRISITLLRQAPFALDSVPDAPKKSKDKPVPDKAISDKPAEKEPASQ